VNWKNKKPKNAQVVKALKKTSTDTGVMKKLCMICQDALTALRDRCAVLKG